MTRAQGEGRLRVLRFRILDVLRLIQDHGRELERLVSLGIALEQSVARQDQIRLRDSRKGCVAIRSIEEEHA